jgi:malonyl-CoA O-methyltransferase
MNDARYPSPRRNDVRRRFDRAAETFDDADFVHRVCGEGLLQRMLPMTIDARTVLDLGCATGTLSRKLASRFRKGRVVSLDLSLPMLRRARKMRSRFARIAEVQADAAAIPLPASCVDVVVANLLLPWIADVPSMLAEVARVLRQDGLFVFASLGPDSLRELREAFEEDEGHVLRFPDMHDIGDALVRAGLRDPVLDVDPLGVEYRSADALFEDLGRCGGRNSLAGRRRGATGKRYFQTVRQKLRDRMRDGRLTLTLELVYGHAWGGAARTAGGEIRVDVADIGGRTRRR